MLIFLAIFFFSHQRKNSLIEKESKKKINAVSGRFSLQTQM